ncbi:Fur family transcriptional regulator [Bacillaceae bacterium S4-13-58]
MNLNEALDLLKNRGYKYTGKREDFLRYLTTENSYRTAKDLLEFMQKTDQNVSVDTVYRNLHLFTELGIVETTEMDGEKYFRVTCDSNQHHHHFICKSCGKTKEIHLCPMDRINKELNGFEIEDHKFEIYGKCPACV